MKPAASVNKIQRSGILIFSCASALYDIFPNYTSYFSLNSVLLMRLLCTIHVVNSAPDTKGVIGII